MENLPQSGMIPLSDISRFMEMADR